MFLLWAAGVLAVVVYFYRTYSRFSTNGVRHLPVIPPLGTASALLLGRQHFSDHLKGLCDKFPNERFVGRYEMTKPVVVIRDLELIKKITIKDFEYFLDHRVFADERIEPVFARNLLSLKGQEWKNMRATLSPSFTSAKIKHMVPFMEEVGEQLIRALKTQLDQSNADYADVECKDLTSRYTNDVIASCAFGLKMDSHSDKENQFYNMGKSIARLKQRARLVFLAMSMCPSLVRKFNITLFSVKAKDFFVDLFLDSMKDRETHNIVRQDMIHLLMKEKGEWSDMDLVAQAMLFFIAGFETISTAMSFTLHELAVNPVIQERLVKEIQEHHIVHAGKFDYTSIQSLTYLDMVVSEVLRLWPPAVSMDRLCVRDYNLGKPNSDTPKDYIIRKGESVNIPVWVFHHDSRYFPNPDKFDPERFSEKNKHSIQPMTYLPFGLGPRNCIGSRFALCELKIFICHILLNFKVSVCNKTSLTSRLSTVTISPTLEDGHWVRFRLRNK